MKASRGRLREPVPSRWHLAIATVATDGFDVLLHADFVVDVHDGHQHGVGADGIPHLQGFDATVRGRCQVGDPATLLLEPPAGCRFAARCKYAMDVCRQAMPPLKEVAPGHFVRCVL